MHEFQCDFSIYVYGSMSAKEMYFSVLKEADLSQW